MIDRPRTFSRRDFLVAATAMAATGYAGDCRAGDAASPTAQPAAASGTADVSTAASPPPLLRVNADKIVTINDGAEVRLRGFRLALNNHRFGLGDRPPYAPDWARKKWPPLTVEHMREIRSWGANVVAIEIWWTGTQGPGEPDETRPQAYHQPGVVLIQTLIRMANEAGLYVIPQIRVCEDPVAARSGKKEWAGWSTHNYVVLNELDDAGQHGRDRFIKYLDWITPQLVNEPNVIGFCPWHFPFHKQGRRSEEQRRIENQKYFGDVVPAMTQVVRKHSDKILFLSSPGLGWFNFKQHPGPVADTNVVYNSGGYGDLEILRDPKHRPWDYDVAKLRHPNPSWIEFKADHNVPFISAEGPGIMAHFFETIPQDRFDLFDAVLGQVNQMNGWLVHSYIPSLDPRMVTIIKKYLA